MYPVHTDKDIAKNNVLTEFVLSLKQHTLDIYAWSKDMSREYWRRVSKSY